MASQRKKYYIFSSTLIFNPKQEFINYFNDNEILIKEKIADFVVRFLFQCIWYNMRSTIVFPSYLSSTTFFLP